MLRTAALLLCALALAAGESAAIAAYKKAMAGDDAIAKREAINALVSKDAGSDDEVLPLLVAAVADRQGNEPAIRALRARTGLTPPAREGASSYPGYPTGDAPADWQAWLSARATDMETKKKLETLTKKAEAPAEQPAEQPAEPEQAAVQPPPRIPTDDLGKLDRIVYKSGRTLIGYIRSKRLDADGNLVSLRVVHSDGVGEEVVDAGVIARIEDDIE
jgi:hypothetical protein